MGIMRLSRPWLCPQRKLLPDSRDGIFSQKPDWVEKLAGTVRITIQPSLPQRRLCPGHVWAEPCLNPCVQTFWPPIPVPLGPDPLPLAVPPWVRWPSEAVSPESAPPQSPRSPELHKSLFAHRPPGWRLAGPCTGWRALQSSGLTRQGFWPCRAAEGLSASARDTGEWPKVQGWTSGGCFELWLSPHADTAPVYFSLLAGGGARPDQAVILTLNLKLAAAVLSLTVESVGYKRLTVAFFFTKLGFWPCTNWLLLDLNIWLQGAFTIWCSFVLTERF